MPLLKKARIEIYIPDLPKQVYQELLNTFENEFTYTFGGCSIIRGLDGSYLSIAGIKIKDRINIIYTDTPFSFEDNFEAIEKYAEELKKAAFQALEEEAVLIALLMIYHTE